MLEVLERPDATLQPAIERAERVRAVGVVGLGYVGLPLAVAFGKCRLPASAYLQKIVRRGCFIDVKSVLDPAPFRKEGLRVWRL